MRLEWNTWLKMTEMQIIARLWSHIADLKLHTYGYSSKTIEQIENELKDTERECEPYTNEREEYYS